MGGFILKLLFLDLEVAPCTAHVWTLFKTTISINQIVAPGYTLCFAAKWLGDKEIIFDSIYKSSPKAMVKRLHGLLNEADAVVTYNGISYDLPTCRKDFILHKLPPPAPFAQVDLLRAVRQQFRFASKKLDYVCQQLGLGSKVAHRGHDLWTGCMHRDASCWGEMEKYNRNDVVLLEKLYHKLLPWISSHPHTGLYDGKPDACPTCGGTKLESRGWSYTRLSKYRRYRCDRCGSWTRAIKRELGSNLRQVQ